MGMISAPLCLISQGLLRVPLLQREPAVLVVADGPDLSEDEAEEPRVPVHQVLVRVGGGGDGGAVGDVLAGREAVQLDAVVHGDLVHVAERAQPALVALEGRSLAGRVRVLLKVALGVVDVAKAVVYVLFTEGVINMQIGERRGGEAQLDPTGSMPRRQPHWCRMVRWMLSI